MDQEVSKNGQILGYIGGKGLKSYPKFWAKGILGIRRAKKNFHFPNKKFWDSSQDFRILGRCFLKGADWG